MAHLGFWNYDWIGLKEKNRRFRGEKGCSVRLQVMIKKIFFM